MSQAPQTADIQLVYIIIIIINYDIFNTNLAVDHQHSIYIIYRSQSPYFTALRNNNYYSILMYFI